MGWFPGLVPGSRGTDIDSGKGGSGAVLVFQGW